MSKTYPHCIKMSSTRDAIEISKWLENNLQSGQYEVCWQGGRGFPAGLEVYFMNEEDMIMYRLRFGVNE